jgi:uncharacterized membrane-anchored protein
MTEFANPALLNRTHVMSVLNVSALNFHVDRERLFNELHTRPFPVIQEGSSVSQLALLHHGQQPDVEYEHLQALCERYSVSPPARGSSCYYQDFGGFELRWERHTEFSTYTVIHRADKLQPFAHTALSLLPIAWLSGLSGEIVSGQHIDIMAMPEQASSPDTLRHYFEGHRLIGSWMGDKEARLWTAYRIHSDGFGRILIQNKHLNPCQTGRLVRRLFELETYRMMVLLAFPMARRIAPEVDTMDTQLAAINQQMNSIKGLEDERRLLAQLSTLAARIEQLISDSNFRFSAARAYYDLVMSRLADLREQEVSGLQTFNEFLRRRLTPAFRTCESVSGQLDDLSQRIDRASELLRTRVDLTLEAQNQDLLQSLNQRSKVQLQLQQAVEGLSVAAISYYLVGLVKYMLLSASDMGWISHAELWVGVSVPVCVFLVWRGVHQLHKGLEKE